jgi:hypothetical protein
MVLHRPVELAALTGQVPIQDSTCPVIRLIIHLERAMGIEMHSQFLPHRMSAIDVFETSHADPHGILGDS